MKTIAAALMVLMMSLNYAQFSFAGEATPQEIVQKTEQAALLIAEKGDDAYRVLLDQKGPYVWKDTYVFVFDLSGNIIAHPVQSMTGKNLMAFKDVNGKIFVAEFLAIGKSAEGKGWSEYMWPKPGEKTPSLKSSYIVKVPGKDLLVGAGVYDLSKVDAEKATKK